MCWHYRVKLLTRGGKNFPKCADIICESPFRTKISWNQDFKKASAGSRITPINIFIIPIVDETEGDYSSPSRDFELDRDCVHLSEILGQGQFGDVYGGLYSHANGTNIIILKLYFILKL